MLQLQKRSILSGSLWESFTVSSTIGSAIEYLTIKVDENMARSEISKKRTLKPSYDKPRLIERQIQQE